jgi:hypothetical protein
MLHGAFSGHAIEVDALQNLGRCIKEDDGEMAKVRKTDDQKKKVFKDKETGEGKRRWKCRGRTWEEKEDAHEKTKSKRE